MPLAETLWRNADPDADREAPLCRRDHLAWVARQLNVPYIFSSRLHGRLALDHPLSGGAGRQEWNQVGDRRLAKASLPAYTSNSANSSPRASVRNRLADPDELPDKMSNGQSGGTIFATRRPEASVFRTTVARHRKHPICDEPEYGIRAE